MDKRKLYQNIADIRKMIFVVTSTGAMIVVFIAALLTNLNPLNLHAIMIWTIGSYIVFSVAGMLLGLVYERIVEEPLLESYREEARARIAALRSGEPERLQMQISTADLEPGMKVIHQVNSPEGALLVRPGAVLTQRLIRNLREAGIETVTVEAQRSATSQFTGGGGGGGDNDDDEMVNI